MRTLDQINADIVANTATYNAALAANKARAAIDKVVNEGGEGYSHAETMGESAFNAWSRTNKVLTDELFAATWTLDTFTARRAAYNAEITKCKSYAAMAALEKRLGYSLNDLKKAKELLSVA